jgi:hypothetical protein
MRASKQTPVSRSDQLRRNRSHSSLKSTRSLATKTQVRTSNIKTRYQNTVPVVRPVRNVLTPGSRSVGVPLINRTRADVRKIFSIPLGAPGAVMTFPSIPFYNVGWRALSGTLVIFLSVILILFTTNPIFRVNQISIKGIQRLNPSEIETLLNLSGSPVYQVDISQVNQQLSSKYSELFDTRVTVSLPANISITTKERQPFIVWQMDNQTYWIDREGVIFLARGEIDTSSLLVIHTNDTPPIPPLPSQDDNNLSEDKLNATPNTPITSKIADPAFLEAIQQLYSKLPPKTSLVYTAKEGMGWKDKRGWVVYLGTDLQNFEMKMQMYNAIVKELKKRGISPVMISLKYLHAPYFRME